MSSRLHYNVCNQCSLLDCSYVNIPLPSCNQKHGVDSKNHRSGGFSMAMEPKGQSIPCRRGVAVQGEARLGSGFQDLGCAGFRCRRLSIVQDRFLGVLCDDSNAQPVSVAVKTTTRSTCSNFESSSFFGDNHIFIDVCCSQKLEETN